MPTSAGAIYIDLKANSAPFERALSGLGGVAKRVGGLLAGALAGVATAKFAQSCVELASDLNEVQNVVDVAFGSMSSRVDEWAATAADSFGLGETMAKRFTGTFGSMAEAFGFAEAQAYEMSTTLAGLAGDVASFYNISQEEAFSKLKGVFTGETEGLKSLGVVMTQAALDEYAMANGWGAVTSQMSEAEKVSLRYAFVQDALNNAAGDFARTSGSWANQVRLLTLRFDALKATIGQSFIAVLLPVVRALNAVILAATNAARAFNRLVSAITGKSMAELTGGAETVSVDLGSAAGSAADLADGYGSAADGAGKAAKAQDKLNRSLAGFDRITKLTSSDTSSGSGGSGGGGGAGGGAGGFGEAVAGEVGTAQAALDNLKFPIALLEALERCKTEFSELGQTIVDGLGWAYEHVLVPLGQFAYETVLPDTLNLVADAVGHLNDFLKKIGDPLGRFLTMCEQLVEFAWNEALQPLLSFATNEVMPVVLDGIATAFEAIVGALEALQPVASWLWENFVKPLAETLHAGFAKRLQAVSAGLEAWAGAGDAARDALDRLRGVWDGIKSKTATLKAKATTTATKVGDWWTSVTAAWKDKTATLRLVLGTLVATVSTWWSKLTAPWKNKNVSLTASKDTEDSTVATWWSTLASKWPGKKVGLTASKDTSDSTVNTWWSTLAAKWPGKKASMTAQQGTTASAVGGWWDKVAAKWPGKKVNLTAQQGTSASAVNSWWNSATANWRDKTATLWLKTAKTGINGISVSSNSKGTTFYVNTFAQGGYVGRNAPRLAIVGDNRREGEIISPESKFQSMLDRAVAMGGSGETDALLRELIGVVRAIDPQLYLDGQAITRDVVSRVNAQTRATGNCPILV